MSNLKLPLPRVGLVVRYEYLWRWQAVRGDKVAEKSRPCLLLSLHIPDTGPPRVLLAPITSKRPDRHASWDMIPPHVRDRLNLPGKESWLVYSEANIDVWPGRHLSAIPDRPTTGQGVDVCYGLSSGDFLHPIHASVGWLVQRMKVKATNRVWADMTKPADPGTVYRPLGMAR